MQNNWRSTQVLTPAHNVVVLPNSVLAKVGLTNLTRPDETHLIVLVVRISADHRPNVVEKILKSALAGCGCIVQDPSPVVALKTIDAIAIEAELQFRVAGPANRTPARNEVIDVVHQLREANGLSLALPAQSYLPIGTADSGNRRSASAL